MSLSSKVILVTGSAGGLGRCIAETLLSRGASVAISDINPDRLASTLSELSATFSPERLLAVQVDVTDEKAVQSLVEQTVQRFHHIDVVVNNAGIMDKFAPVGDCDTGMWESILNVNLTGAYYVTKHAMPHLLARAEERGGGEQGSLVINIGSTASFSGLTAGVAYTVSKHGLVAMTKHTAGYYGPRGVYSVALQPGGMSETRITDAFASGMHKEGLNAIKEAHPKTINVPISHVARYAAFLSEDGIGQSSNGGCVTITGNWPEA